MELAVNVAACYSVRKGIAHAFVAFIALVVIASTKGLAVAFVEGLANWPLGGDISTLGGRKECNCIISEILGAVSQCQQ